MVPHAGPLSTPGAIPRKVRRGFPAGIAEKQRVREFRDSEKSGNALAYPQACSSKPKAEAGGNPLRCVIFAIRAVEQGAGAQLRQAGPAGGSGCPEALPPEGLRRYQTEFGSSIRKPRCKGDRGDLVAAAAAHQGSQRSVTS